MKLEASMRVTDGKRHGTIVSCNYEAVYNRALWAVVKWDGEESSQFYGVIDNTINLIRPLITGKKIKKRDIIAEQQKIIEKKDGAIKDLEEQVIKITAERDEARRNHVEAVKRRPRVDHSKRYYEEDDESAALAIKIFLIGAIIILLLWSIYYGH